MERKSATYAQECTRKIVCVVIQIFGHRTNTCISISISTIIQYLDHNPPQTKTILTVKWSFLPILRSSCTFGYSHYFK